MDSASLIISQTDYLISLQISAPALISHKPTF